MGEERCDEISQEGPSMRGIAAELAISRHSSGHYEENLVGGGELKGGGCGTERVGVQFLFAVNRSVGQRGVLLKN